MWKCHCRPLLNIGDSLQINVLFLNDIALGKLFSLGCIDSFLEFNLASHFLKQFLLISDLFLKIVLIGTHAFVSQLQLFHLLLDQLPLTVFLLLFSLKKNVAGSVRLLQFLLELVIMN